MLSRAGSRDFENLSRAVPRDSTGSRGIGLPIWSTGVTSIIYPFPAGPLLYNLKDDPLETTNIFDQPNEANFLSDELFYIYRQQKKNLTLAAEVYFGKYMDTMRSKGYVKPKYPKKFWTMLSTMNSVNFKSDPYYYSKDAVF